MLGKIWTVMPFHLYLHLLLLPNLQQLLPIPPPPTLVTTLSSPIFDLLNPFTALYPPPPPTPSPLTLSSLLSGDGGGLISNDTFSSIAKK
ncbi:hypothetical protein Sjap_022764 [Stephania japonica]|uniref:Uncharacterized protein n=1 Tax=Stephania japonica TaxID=461633 RepID=A0AAP0ESJ8_9MAGN